MTFKKYVNQQSQAPRLALLLVSVMSSLFICCGNEYKFSTKWNSDFQTLGSGSSSMCADLNNDGILDIVIGASKNEFQQSDSSVLALDGSTGAVLWNVKANDQIVGSATFLDITGDSIPEVYIGGRSSEFICINGKSGDVIWRFEKNDSTPLYQCCLRFNFFNSQIVPDQSGDGIKDLLVTNGGNAKARANTNEGRRAGVLAIFNSKTGALIAADTMPDGKETYMSPVVYDFAGTGNAEVIFGTGGETLGGHLYRVAFKDLVKGDISKAIQLASGDDRGFIAPVTIADVNVDGTKDIVANWFGGKMMAIDGRTHKLIWERIIPNTEIYSIPTPGFFNDDLIPDFFSSFNTGAWPDNKGAIQVVIDGENGNILRSDSLGCMGYSSGVTYDLNNDGYDEIFWSVNDFLCNTPGYIETDLGSSSYTLQVLDVKSSTLNAVMEPIKAKNISSTPWIGDLDHDGYLDLVICIQRNTHKVDQYGGIRVERLKSNIKISTRPTWGAYLGNDGTGVFTGRN